MKSVLQKHKRCYVCGDTYNLHQHHIFFGTANRKMSEKRGLKVWLCAPHHNASDYGVHFNKCLDNRLKHIAQRYYEENIGSREDFRREFGKSYLEEE